MALIKTRRRFIDKEVEVGDMVYIHNPGMFCNANLGQELLVVDIQSYTGTMIYAYNERKGKVVVLHDGEYKVFVEERSRYVKTEVITKKFLGIPYGKEEYEVWEIL